MLFALLSSLRTLVCSLVILFFVVYFFAVMICQGVTDFRFQENGGSEAENKALAHLYGSLSQSVFTLFSSVSDGMGWTNAIEPLQKMDGIYTYSVLIYITLVIFGVTNVVTSVFVESAMKSERHYRELIVQEKQHAKEVAAGHMREVFKAMDADGSGEISAEEMDFFLTEPALNNYVEALGISAENTRMLFKLMDVDGSGRIDVDEFCEGCLRLQGEAKSIDVHLGNYQVRQFLSKWADFTDYVDDRFLELGALMEDYTNDEEGDLRRRVSEDFGSQRAASHQSNPRDTVVKLEGILGDSAVTPEENTNPTCLHDSRSSQPKNQRPSMSSAASMEEEDTVAVGEDADSRKPPRGAVRERVQDSSAVGEDDEARVPSRARRSVHQSVYQRGRDRAVKVSLPGLALEDERKTKGTGTPALKMRCIDEGQIAGNGNDGGRSTMPTIVGCSTGGRSEDEQKKGVVTLG